MSHEDQEIICPNCGFHATHNYCAQCGQPTHLHNDTFWGLITHFVGHYFHYDSKFWQTMKALWFSPGKLTLAYWNKQRMRYIAPISLYIFVSFVFFFIVPLVPGTESKKGYVKVSRDSTAVKHNNIVLRPGRNIETDSTSLEGKFLKAFAKSVRKTADIMSKEDGRAASFVFHAFSQVMFFLIPLMGFVLLLLFHRRKDLNYVNHVIFAIHYHTFWFSFMLFVAIYPFETGSTLLYVTSFVITVAYFIIALKRVYNVKWVRSVLYSLVIAFFYEIFAFIGFLTIMMVTASLES